MEMSFKYPSEDEAVELFRQEVRASIAPDRLEEFDNDEAAQALIDALSEELREHARRTANETFQLLLQQPTPEDIKERLLRFIIEDGLGGSAK